MRIKRSVDFVYYPVPSEDGVDCTFLPVWEFDAANDRGTLTRVLINATDGSLVEIFY